MDDEQRDFPGELADLEQPDGGALPKVIVHGPGVVKLRCQSENQEDHLVVRQVGQVVSVSAEGLVGCIARNIEIDGDQARVLRDWLSAYISRNR